MGKEERGKGTGLAEEKREMGGGQGPLKRQCSQFAQEVSLVAAAEDVACQKPKVRPAQRPEY